MTAPGDDTRARILEAALREVEERGTSDVTMAGVAAAAGVSRQLVYFHFANRAGLLTAMAGHRDETAGFVEQARISRSLPPAEGFEHLLRAWCAYMPQIEPITRALEAALVSGEDGAVAWRDRMGELREALRIALDRLARRDGLAAGWSVDAGADWAWSRIQPSTWRHLVGERGWTGDEYTERTVASLLKELVASPT
jgi:AcrR family transcriptional regulator